MRIGNLLWVATITLTPGAPGRFVGIDPATLRIVESVTTDHGAYISRQGFGSVWQFSYDAGAVIRLPLDALGSGS